MIKNLTEAFEYRLERRKKFDRKDWMKSILTKRLPKKQVDQLVLDFLISEG